MKYRGQGLTVIIIAGILIALVLPNFAPRGKPASACTKQNLHSIQLEVERYYTNYQEYPPSIEALLAANAGTYALPTNEYKAEAGEGKQPMVELSKVHGGSHPDIAGDFVYLPRLEERDGELRVSGYTLIAFGKPGNLFEHSKIVHVAGAVPIFALDSGVDKKPVSVTPPTATPPAPPAEREAEEAEQDHWRPSEM